MCETLLSRKITDKLFVKLGYTHMDDWYKVTKEDFYKYGGKKLLENYSGFPSEALQHIYPDHNWVVWKFKRVPYKYWQDPANRLSFFDWLGKTLGFKHMYDWY